MASYFPFNPEACWSYGPSNFVIPSSLDKFKTFFNGVTMIEQQLIWISDKFKVAGDRRGKLFRISASLPSSESLTTFAFRSVRLDSTRLDCWEGNSSRLNGSSNGVPTLASHQSAKTQKEPKTYTILCLSVPSREWDCIFVRSLACFENFIRMAISTINSFKSRCIQGLLH